MQLFFFKLFNYAAELRESKKAEKYLKMGWISR